MTLSAEDRRSAILDELETKKKIAVADLSRRFGISEVSIRKDLETLEQQGLLQRVHGGAIKKPRSVAEAPWQVRMDIQRDKKERIGRAAAQLIQRGDRLIFDSGTTPLQVAMHIDPGLLTSGNLTIITNSLPVANMIDTQSDTQLIMLGGIYLPNYGVTVGPQTIEHIEKMHADIAFIGTDGLSLSQGVTTTNVLEAEVARTMALAANEVVILADSSKIGRKGFITIIPLEKITKLVTDREAPEEFVATLRDLGAEVILA
jgi:DeoR/GlpR family transcriptional regulator of sugar metabolism